MIHVSKGFQISATAAGFNYKVNYCLLWSLNNRVSSISHDHIMIRQTHHYYKLSINQTKTQG